jgi:amino acid transporter
MKPNPVAERWWTKLTLADLSSLSVSSVAPLFSIAAAGQVLVQLMGPHVMWAVLAVAVPFVMSSWIFKLLNSHFPNAGASYHWSRRVLGPRVSEYQSWILLMAYFWSIPPIMIPAAQQTLTLLRAPSTPDAVILFSALWVAISAGVLLRGSRATARVTQVFLAMEVAAIAVMVVVGAGHWHPVSVPRAFSFSWSHLVVAMVVGATIVDGWEIDSYAAEESRRPRQNPGTGGVVGALMVLAYYGATWSILLHNVPVAQLAAHHDVFKAWVLAVMPHAGPSSRWVLLPVLASTAGSLWLTTFILSRALYAMGRDRILPVGFTRRNAEGAPVWAILAPSALGLAVVSASLFWPSVTELFNLLLSSAGFFLVLEFLVDSITATVFLTTQHHTAFPHGWDRHRHRMLALVSILTSAWLGGIVALFFVLNSSLLGAHIHQLLLAMLGLGLVYVVARRRSGRRDTVFVFEPDPGE